MHLLRKLEQDKGEFMKEQGLNRAHDIQNNCCEYSRFRKATDSGDYKHLRPQWRLPKRCKRVRFTLRTLSHTRHTQARRGRARHACSRLLTACGPAHLCVFFSPAAREPRSSREARPPNRVDPNRPAPWAPGSRTPRRGHGRHGHGHGPWHPPFPSLRKLNKHPSQTEQTQRCRCNTRCNAAATQQHTISHTKHSYLLVSHIFQFHTCFCVC